MPFRTILVAIDGSECADRALDVALELAALARGTVTALAVEGPLPAYAATVGEVDEVKREKDAFFERVSAAAQSRAAATQVTVDVIVRAGHPADVISGVAEEGRYDLVVLGHRGHALRDRLLGSTADRVSEHAHCPVLIVR